MPMGAKRRASLTSATQATQARSTAMAARSQQLDEDQHWCSMVLPLIARNSARSASGPSSAAASASLRARRQNRLHRSLVAGCVALARTAIAIDRGDKFRLDDDEDGLGIDDDDEIDDDGDEVAEPGEEAHREQVSRMMMATGSARSRAHRRRMSRGGRASDGSEAARRPLRAEAEDDDDDDDDDDEVFALSQRPLRVRGAMGRRHVIGSTQIADDFSGDEDMAQLDHDYDLRARMEDEDADVRMFGLGHRRRRHHGSLDEGHVADSENEDEDEDEDEDEVEMVEEEEEESIFHRRRRRRLRIASSPAVAEKYRGALMAHNRRARRRLATRDPAVELERRRRRRAQRRLFQGRQQQQQRRGRLSSIGSLSPGNPLGLCRIPASIADIAGAVVGGPGPSTPLTTAAGATTPGSAARVGSSSAEASRRSVVRSARNLAAMASPAAIGAAAFYSPGIIRVRREPDPVKPKRNPRDLDALRHEMVKTPERPTGASPLVPSYDAEAEDASAESEENSPAIRRRSSRRPDVDSTPVNSPLVMTPQRGLHT